MGEEEEECENGHTQHALFHIIENGILQLVLGKVRVDGRDRLCGAGMTALLLANLIPNRGVDGGGRILLPPDVMDRARGVATDAISGFLGPELNHPPVESLFVGLHGVDSLRRELRLFHQGLVLMALLRAESHDLLGRPGGLLLQSMRNMAEGDIDRILFVTILASLYRIRRKIIFGQMVQGIGVAKLAVRLCFFYEIRVVRLYGVRALLIDLHHFFMGEVFIGEWILHMAPDAAVHGLGNRLVGDLFYVYVALLAGDLPMNAVVIKILVHMVDLRDAFIVYPSKTRVLMAHQAVFLIHGLGVRDGHERRQGDRHNRQQHRTHMR